MRRIDELFLEYPFYGSRQMVRHLWREGICVGRHRVRVCPSFCVSSVMGIALCGFNGQMPESDPRTEFPHCPGPVNREAQYDRKATGARRVPAPLRQIRKYPKGYSLPQK